MTSLWDRAVRAPSILVATDYDGTISEIAPTPHEAMTESGAVRALSALSARASVHVAIVSGRRADEIAARTASLRGIIRVAEHGAVIDAPGWREAVPEPSAAVLSRLVREGSVLAEGHAGVLVEPKVYGVALHMRAVGEAARPALEKDAMAWSALARDAGMNVQRGRGVLEARIAGASKASALERILARLPRGTMLVYAGDDETDETALELTLRLDGIAVRIASRERGHGGPASLTVGSPSAWVEMLSELATARAST